MASARVIHNEVRSRSLSKHHRRSGWVAMGEREHSGTHQSSRVLQTDAVTDGSAALTRTRRRVNVSPTCKRTMMVRHVAEGETNARNTHSHDRTGRSRETIESGLTIVATVRAFSFVATLQRLLLCIILASLLPVPFIAQRTYMITPFRDEKSVTK